MFYLSNSKKLFGWVAYYLAECDVFYMKIVYIANIRFPTEKAHGIQIMNTCTALTSLDHDVELIVPYRKNPIREDASSFYGISTVFFIRRLFCPDLLFLGNIGYLIHSIFFLLRVLFLYAWRKDIVFYSRDAFILLPLSFFQKNIFLESHEGKNNLITRSLLKRIAGMICITHALKDFYKEQGLAQEKICVAPDAVDLRRFSRIEDKEVTRRLLGLPNDKPIVTYVGSLTLYKWKGADVLLEAARILRDQCYVLIVGGRLNEIKSFAHLSVDNVLFVGQQPHDKIPLYLRASDVLVLPNKAGDEVSERFTSPMKLFEYMASGVPIIASDLPSIREILNEQSAVLISPNDHRILAQQVIRLLENPSIGVSLAQQARQDVQVYTWDMRAKEIANFIKDIL